MKTLYKVEQIIYRFKTAHNIATDTELSRMLGVSKSTVSNWIARNSLDYNLVFSKCEHINIDWLLTGNGEMLKPHSQPFNKEPIQYSHTPKTNNEINASLLSEIQRQAEEIGRLKELLRQYEQANARSPCTA